MKNNKIYFIYGILIIILIGVGLYYFFLYDNNSNKTNNINKMKVLSSPGTSDINCSSNDDCINICENDGCLISSCVKSQGQNEGKCACFDLCGV